MNNFVIEEKNDQGMLPFLIKLCLTRSNTENVSMAHFVLMRDVKS